MENGGVRRRRLSEANKFAETKSANRTPLLHFNSLFLQLELTRPTARIRYHSECGVNAENQEFDGSATWNRAFVNPLESLFILLAPAQARVQNQCPSHKDEAMNSPKRFHDADTEDLPPELTELGSLLRSLETDRTSDLQVAYNRVVESVRRRKRILNLVQEALSQLHLDVKYLMFDLEMTRRERDELQSRIEEEDHEI